MSFRPAGVAVPQDWQRLSEWLALRGKTLDLSVPPRQFAGGLANLNYLLSVDGGLCVLRRPPAGPLAEGANDMVREFTVLRSLAPHFSLAPQALDLCEDSDVLGAPFQLLEFRSGRAVGAALPEWLPTGDQLAPRELSKGMVGAMAALHRLDPDEIGLGTLGKPDGFARRQVEGWARRAEAAWGGDPPAAVPSLVAHLRGHVPGSARTSLLHGDVKFDNMLFDAVELRPVALFDWDMATRGDCLFDLGVMLSYWIEPGDPVELHRLQQAPSLEPGFPSRADLVAAYFELMPGIDADDLDFFVVLARLRLAVVFRQLSQLWMSGAVPDPRYEGFARLSLDILAWAADSLTRPMIGSAQP